METISKKALVKDFILKDKERFLLASDIFETFEPITDDMLETILQKVVENINEKNSLGLKLSEFAQKANWYWFTIEIKPEYSLWFCSHYYFKTYEMALRGTQKEGFDKNNPMHMKLRDLLKNEFPDSWESNWQIRAINNENYEMNIGSGYKELFAVYSEKQLTTLLCENFNRIFGPKIVQVINILDNLLCN